jgi:hypothetical protein
MDMENMRERDLLRVWDTHQKRRTWRDAISRGGDRDVAERALAELEPVTALDALEANRRLVELLIGRRWSVMRDAIEAGASWSDVGAALGMSRQGAHDWYQRKIQNQETYVPDFHDASRARAVLESGTP